MKTDTQLHRDVLDELKWEPSVKDAEIGVAAKDGVVTLTGYVSTFAQKFAAERAAERIGGVKAIADDIQVKLLGTHERTDTDIAHAVANALKWDIEVPDSIKAKVDNGWITLDGKVEWYYQKAAAERAVRFLTGVRGVTNMIAVKPRVSAVEVSQKIQDSLKRTAELDAQRITVEAREGKVTLRGNVRSYAERQDAERAAWAVPGVTFVEDKITIGA